jgi:hypothetical protein
MAALYALGEPGDPVPPRFGPGPGMPRPTPVPLVPPTYPPRSAASGPGSAVRPGGSRRPAGAGDRARRNRTVVAAAGALGLGFVAAGVLTAGAGASSGPVVRTPVAQLTVQPSPRQPAGSPLTAGVLNAGFTPAMPSSPPVRRLAGSAAARYDAPAARGVVAHQAVVALVGH